MDWLNILDQVFDVCLVPLLGLITSILIVYIKEKIAEGKEKTNSELADKYLSLLEITVIDCIRATNQTYVDVLKKQGKFDAEAQKEAFKMTFAAVTDILSDDAKKYLNEACGDLNKYITELIESTVKNVKTNVA